MKTNILDFYVAVAVVIIIVAIVVMRDENKLSIIKRDFDNKVFVGLFILITIVSVVGLLKGNVRVKNAINNAVIAFLIAYLSRLDMVFAAYFLVGTFVYFTYSY